MKKCSKCSTEQPFENFNKEIKRKDGLYPWCKECLKKHRQERYIKRLKSYRLTHKVCSFCQENKPREEFRLTEAKNLKPRCISCEDEIEINTSSGKRRCGSCKEWLELEKFFKSRRDGHHATCKNCTDKHNQKPSVHEKNRDRSLKKYFGISLSQYRDLLDKQNYKCPVCLKSLEGISNPVDHAHRGRHEGKIRAILHMRCNTFVVHNHYNSGELRRAAELIDNPLTDWVVPEEFLKSRKRKRKKRK